MEFWTGAALLQTSILLKQTIETIGFDSETSRTDGKFTDIDFIFIA